MNQATIKLNDWLNYAKRLEKISKKASTMMKEYIDKNGVSDMESLISYACMIIVKYGEASSELACQMYDAISEIEGLNLPPADPAKIVTQKEVARDILKQTSALVIEQVPGRLVKMAAADTMLHNAIRDGAEVAWINFGDTCAFCRTLASNGWQKVSKNTLKNGHARHIHSNCDCQYAVRHTKNLNVSGYDSDALQKEYSSYSGTPQQKINAMRRADYSRNKDEINRRRRELYKEKKETSDG